MHEAKILFFVLFLSCSASDNVLNDGSPDGQGPIKVTPPITPIDATPAKSPSDLTIPYTFFNGDFPVLTPRLGWVNPTEEDYDGLQIALLNNQNQFIVPFKNLSKETTNYNFELEALEECTPHRYVIRGTLEGAKGNPAFSDEFIYDNTAPQGPINPTLIDDSTKELSAYLSWNQYDENCELASLESAIVKSPDLEKIKPIKGGEWEAVQNNQVQRSFGDDNKLDWYEAHYTLLKGTDQAGNSKVYLSEAWHPLGPLDAVRVCEGESDRQNLKVNWSKPNNQNAAGKGEHQRTVLEYRLFKRATPKTVDLTASELEYTFSKYDLYPCKTLYVQVKTYNGLWSEPSNELKVKINYNHEFSENEYFNYSSEKESEIIALEDNTEITLNNSKTIILNKDETYTFKSQSGDYAFANNKIKLVTESGKAWAEPKDFIQELEINKEKELVLYSKDNQLVTIEGKGKQALKVFLKPNELKSVRVNGFKELIADYPLLVFEVSKDSKGKVLKEVLK